MTKVLNRPEYSREALIKRRQAEKYRHAIKSKRSRIGFNINASKSHRFLQ